MGAAGVSGNLRLDERGQVHGGHAPVALVQVGAARGGQAALFVADWLAKRALPPETDRMHDALAEWQGGAFLGRMRLAIAVR